VSAQTGGGNSEGVYPPKIGTFPTPRETRLREILVLAELFAPRHSRARQQSPYDFKIERCIKIAVVLHFRFRKEVSMLSVTRPNDLTRAEQVAAKAAYAASKWQPFFIIGIGVLAVVTGFINGSSRDTLVWMGTAFAAIAWTTWEHWGFSNLLERRDTEIRRLKDAIKAV
jgi:hypothetical protein